LARNEQWTETGVGLVVLIAAGGFLAYALGVGGFAHASSGYDVSARFGQVGGLAPGANVTVAGVKVGTVASMRLDPKSYLAEAHLTLQPDVKLPSDSTAKITSDGLLGGVHVAIEPGGAADDLKAGGEITNTQGAVDLFGLIGQVMRPASPAPAAAETGAAATPAAPANGAQSLPDVP
jgi:phospholipid/cholesterol/gamma-HCH transport system substrate-binding protein